MARVSCSFISTLILVDWADVRHAITAFPLRRRAGLLRLPPRTSVPAVCSRAGLTWLGRSRLLPRCRRGQEVSRHSFPVSLQLSSRTVWTSVHHVIRDPKALCASKNGASKAHSLGALLNSDSATRRSAKRSPKDTQCATSAGSTGSPGLTAALRLPFDRDFASLVLVKPGDDSEKELDESCTPHRTTPPPAAAQDFAPRKIASA